MDKQNIVETEFAYCFEKERPHNTNLLSKASSNSLWQEKIDKQFLNYFQLTNDCWVIKTDMLITANWLDSYNNEQSDEIESVLNTINEWHDNHVIYFCINGSTVIESDWKEFKRYWKCFLCAFDDCPIVLNAAVAGVALIFAPLGSVFIAKQD
jgi:transposase-like protein